MFCPSCGNEIPSIRRPCPGCRSTAHIVEMTRPAVVGILAVLDILVGAFALLTALALVAVALREPIALVWVLLAGSLGTLSLVAGIGLWNLKPWGRTLQLIVSAVGLIGFPAGTILHGFILYYMTRPGMKILFSEKQVEELTPEEALALAKISGGGGTVIVVIIACIGLLLICGIMSAIAVPNFLNAVDRGKQKRSMADCRSIATAVESYREAVGRYPDAANAQELEAIIEPGYLRTMPLTDGWGHPFLVKSSAGGYEIRSPGKDGAVDSLAPQGPTMDFNADIVWRDGEFVQWPEGFQR